MYGGVCYHHYTSGLVDLGMTAQRIGMQMQSRFIINDPLLINARNLLVANFLQTDYTHFLFVDADIGFSPNDVTSMIEADVDVIAGTYPMKVVNWARVHRAAIDGAKPRDLHKYSAFHTFRPIKDETQEIPLDRPYEVAHVATGFMLIKRSVFECLSSKVVDYEYIHPKDPPVRVKKYFDTQVIDGVLYGEDSAFCKLARENGIRVYLAPWVCLPHAGTFSFDGQLV